MEYKCDLCGANATVHITKIVNGQKIKMHLCEACAQKNAELCSAGFPPDIIPNIKKLEEKILEAIPNAVKSEAANIKCPTCNTSLAEFEKRGRFSCPDCYKAFERKVLELLAQMHGAIKHAGKRPASFENAPKKKSRKGDATASNQIELELGDLGEVFSNIAEDKDFDKQAVEVFKELGFGSIDIKKSNLVPAEDSGSEAVKPLKSKKVRLEELKKQLEKAILDERYEDAAALRDEINSIENNKE